MKPLRSPGKWTDDRGGVRRAGSVRVFRATHESAATQAAGYVLFSGHIQLHKADEVLDLTRVVFKPSEARVNREKSNGHDKE